MKRVLALVVAAGLTATTAMGSNINISVQQTNGTNAIGPVAPGASVDYKVIGTLTDDLNEGLALIGLSLDFTGGPLTQANSPVAGTSSCLEPMRAFVIPDGITNPDGYGGTVIGGDLIQCGGAQNTINNDVNNAAFPIGLVTTGIAQPGGCGPAVLLTGSLTVPLGTPDGDYFLNAFDVFANVIEDGQDGTGAFWATVAAGANAPTNLTITVMGDVLPILVSSVPAFIAFGQYTPPAFPTNSTLWRNSRHVIRLTFDGALPVTAPTAAQLDIREMLPLGAFGDTNLSASFTYTIDGNTLRIREPSPTTTVLAHRKWYAIRNLGGPGGWTGVANFEAQFLVQVGDASGDRFVTATDVGQVNAAPAGAQPDQSRFDINGDGFKTATDVGITNASISGLVAKPTGH